MLVVDRFSELAERSDVHSLLDRWYNKASFHPNRSLNWHYSNYLIWLKAAQDIEQAGILLEEDRFFEPHPRALERLFDFPSATLIAMGSDPAMIFGYLASAKSRLLLFDQYLFGTLSDIDYRPFKGNDFGARLGLMHLQNGELICQRMPGWIKPARDPCIPTASGNR